MSEEINPYAAPRSAPAPAPTFEDDRGARRRKFAIAFATVLLVGSPIAAAVAMYDIESIVVSGAILTVIALVLIVISIRPDLRMLGFLSLATIAMSVGCFLTIFLNSWSPGDAQTPIGWATVVYAVAIQLGWILVRSVHRGHFLRDL